MLAFRRKKWLAVSTAAIAAFALNASAAEVGPQRRFDWKRDTLGFSNETLWAYGVDEQGRGTHRAKSKPPEYSRHCFVMCRAVMQFYKFVRFDKTQAKLAPAGYRELVRRISRIPVWRSPGASGITIPGYADLRSFSAEHTAMLQDELGVWWASYWRIGNWRMAMPFPRSFQRQLAHELTKRIDRGEIQAVFMTRFKPLNHCLVAYDYERLGGGDVRFWTYDPNHAASPRALDFKNADSSFYWGKTNYFAGGRVNVFNAYVSPLQ